jgi:hypothetical protein
MGQIRRTVQDRVLLRTKLSNKGVFLRSDFLGIASYDLVGRALTKLVCSGKLVKIGYGLYVRARPSLVTGEPTIAIKGGFKSAVFIALDRLEIKYSTCSASKKYNDRKSTQIPANLVVYVGPGLSRSIAFRKTRVRFIVIAEAELDRAFSLSFSS